MNKLTEKWKGGMMEIRRKDQEERMRSVRNRKGAKMEIRKEE
jgi:hypothetical protein